MIYKTKDIDLISNANALYINTFGIFCYDCTFSSCLKKNLYINKGLASFCKKHVLDSVIGDIYKDNEIFKTEKFHEFLQKWLSKEEPV